MLGERLAELRKDKGLTQEGLAKQLGVSSTTISGYETGRNTPNDEIKVKIAKFFNISLDYLLGAIDAELPLDRTGKIQLPRNFPESERYRIEELIELIMRVQG